MNAPRTSGLVRWLGGLGAGIKPYVGPMIGFSVIANLLLLVSPFYMLQVYDRILTSGSIDTLIWLTVISIFLLGIYAAAEIGRRRLASLAAADLDMMLSKKMFGNFADDPLGAQDIPAKLRHIARIRGFLANQAILPFFDLPFAPLFLAILFVIHPLIGVIGFLGALLMIAIAMTAEATTRSSHAFGRQADSQAFEFALDLSRNRSAIVSMGLARNALTRWEGLKQKAHLISLDGGRREVSFASTAKSLRQILQILVLGAGGALAVQQQVSPGAIVAGSIILGRALAPIDQIVGGWRNITSIREAWESLGEDLDPMSEDIAVTPMPRPEAVLKFDRFAVAAPGQTLPLVRPFNLNLKGGTLVGLIGNIGTGKTSFLQTIAGAWSPHEGGVSLGGRNIHAWPSDDRGVYIGYVPQSVELLPGTIGENIARMKKADPETIIAAAVKAGAHQFILSLEKGYDTRVGPNAKQTLSAGQTQLIGLARAVYGAPVLLILDEPTANLDRESSDHVSNLLRALATQGTIILVATHDERLITSSDHIMAIRESAMVFADTEKYLKSLTRPSGNNLQTLHLHRDRSA